MNDLTPEEIATEIERVAKCLSKSFWSVAQRLCSLAEDVRKLSPEPKEDQLIQKIGMAYGHLWHVNNEPGTPAQHSPEKAAMSARHILRDSLTSEQRGFYINAVREALQLSMSVPIDESDLDPLPFVPAEPNNEPLSHQGIFSAVNHFAREILRMTDAVTVECVPHDPPQWCNCVAPLPAVYQGVCVSCGKAPMPSISSETGDRP